MTKNGTKRRFSDKEKLINAKLLKHHIENKYEKKLTGKVKLKEVYGEYMLLHTIKYPQLSYSIESFKKLLKECDLIISIDRKHKQTYIAGIEKKMVMNNANDELLMEYSMTGQYEKLNEFLLTNAVNFDSKYNNWTGIRWGAQKEYFNVVVTLITYMDIDVYDAMTYMSVSLRNGYSENECITKYGCYKLIDVLIKYNIIGINVKQYSSDLCKTIKLILEKVFLSHATQNSYNTRQKIYDIYNDFDIKKQINRLSADGEPYVIDNDKNYGVFLVQPDILRNKIPTKNFLQDANLVKSYICRTCRETCNGNKTVKTPFNVLYSAYESEFSDKYFKKLLKEIGYNISYDRKTKVYSILGLEYHQINEKIPFYSMIYEHIGENTHDKITNLINHCDSLMEIEKEINYSDKNNWIDKNNYQSMELSNKIILKWDKIKDYVLELNRLNNILVKSNDFYKYINTLYDNTGYVYTIIDKNTREIHYSVSSSGSIYTILMKFARQINLNKGRTTMDEFIIRNKDNLSKLTIEIEEYIRFTDKKHLFSLSETLRKNEIGAKTAAKKTVVSKGPVNICPKNTVHLSDSDINPNLSDDENVQICHASHKWDKNSIYEGISNTPEEIDKKYNLLKKCYNEVKNSNDKYKNCIDKKYKNGKIYIVNILVGDHKKYIGSTTNYGNRKKNHLDHVLMDKKNPLYSDINTSNLEPEEYEKTFDINIIEKIQCNNYLELLLREDYWIEKYDSFRNGYNRKYNCIESIHVYKKLTFEEFNNPTNIHKIKVMLELALKSIYVISMRDDDSNYAKRNALIKITNNKTQKSLVQYAAMTVAQKMANTYSYIKRYVCHDKLNELALETNTQRFYLELIENSFETFNMTILTTYEKELSMKEANEQIKLYTYKDPLCYNYKTPEKRLYGMKTTNYYKNKHLRKRFNKK
jgi:hypothetical protein